MAYVLSLSPTSPALTPVNCEAAARSCSSAASIGSGGTVQHHRLRSISTNSLSSAGSYFIPSWRRSHEPASTPPRSASSMNLNFGKIRTQFDRRSFSATNSRRTSLASAISGNCRPESVAVCDPWDCRLVDVAESEDEPTRPSEDSERLESEPESEDDLEAEKTIQLGLGTSVIDHASSDMQATSPDPPAFKRWVSRLRRKHVHPVVPRKERWVLDDFDIATPSSAGKSQRSHHRKSESQSSSLRFVTAVRSATATLASASIATLSRRTTKWRRGQQRSSLISERDARPSIDSVRSVIDEAAKQRSRKRREKVEELIRTEENYVADVKALSNAYFTILDHQPTSSSFARPCAQKIIADILDLHDKILGDLYNAVPFSEYDQCTAKISAPGRAHTRWHSVDVVPQRPTPKRVVLSTIRQGRRSLNISRSSEDDHAMLRCSPQIVAAVAKVFANHTGRFKAYEGYGANYDLVQRDIDETQRHISIWADFDKAIEALSLHVNPTRSQEANRKKAMTVKDLLIKPIQRLPRYELLFNDLSKLTPVYDDPESHTTIEDLRVQLSEICQRTNEAKENPTKLRTLETTCLIGDRLSFSGQVPKSVFLQLLGQVDLCGCLYIAYRTRDRIKGCYAICLLFDSYLLLAAAEEDQPKYKILAGIALANATVEESDNLKGLQCHTAPHSWKLVFEHAARMYEVICVACSATEADAWRSHIAEKIETQAAAVMAAKASVFELSSPMTSEMRSIGKAFGKPGSFVRRMSVHRAATIGPTTDLNQVIIKNTQSMKEMQENESQVSLKIPRSQSVATPSHVQTLAPRRAERHRLESILSDVWTKNTLPYPGMVRRSDPIRASANHVIRKFSMASITSNFSSSKRTPSYASIASSRKEDMPPSRRDPRRESRSGNMTRPPVVDFHNAPDAFLPADFDLQDQAAKRKKSALRTFTMTMERPFSPLLGNDNKPSGLRRAQSVRDLSDGGAAPQSKPTPSPIPTSQETKPQRPVYSVIQERPKTPASFQATNETATRDENTAKEPSKSKSRKLLRLFG
ncbi:hypothetical protein M409DRAFT_64916 [Zasmidium cellare ATCC 36951]|uniref:DH domain-containing protein n=1 Tax=Zasmidium cellare ATCC 36951 TaxID=1080233 RepID=A0A6A6CPX4_ZASCE|nr:uncharacterized protein M409DRAFT_64916 [Zasmidium cellare ATCC 36951]KAF2169155.1 hypothetical protein M409DRAFT_64916 [Zasmidium cellare ATCC 36951]